MIRAAIKSIPRTSNRPRPRRNPWWTEECTKAIRRRKIALRKFQRSSLIVDKIDYCRARAIAKRVLAQTKKISSQKYISSININTPMSKIWKRIRKIRGKCHNAKSPYLIIDDVHFTDKLQVAEKFGTHYELISSRNSYSNNFKRISKMQEKLSIKLSLKRRTSL